MFGYSHLSLTSTFPSPFLLIFSNGRYMWTALYYHTKPWLCSRTAMWVQYGHFPKSGSWGWLMQWWKDVFLSPDRLDPGFGLWFMGGYGGFGVNLWFVLSFFSPILHSSLFTPFLFPILAFWLACMFNVQKGRECFSLVMSVNVLVWWTRMPLVFGLLES